MKLSPQAELLLIAVGAGVAAYTVIKTVNASATGIASGAEDAARVVLTTLGIVLIIAFAPVGA